MPIKGVSEVRRVSWAGRFYLGEPMQEGGTKRRHPKAIDYFRFEPNDPRDRAGFEELYGKRPKALRIFFPCDDPAIFLPQWLKAYGRGRGLYCRGDGETAQRVETKVEIRKVDGEDRKIQLPVMLENGRPKTHEIPCVPDKAREDCCPIWRAGDCRQVANLTFSLADFRPFTYWTIATGSWNGIVHLNSSIDSIRQIMGGIGGLALRLVVQPKQARDPKSGSLRTVFVMALETLPDDERKLITPPDQVFGLPAPDTAPPVQLLPHGEGAEDLEVPRTEGGALVPVPEGDAVFQDLERRARAINLTRGEWRKLVEGAEGNLVALDQGLTKLEKERNG